MIHRIGTIRANLHLKHRIDAGPADPLDRNPRRGQILSQPPVIDSEINKVANPVRGEFHTVFKKALSS